MLRGLAVAAAVVLTLVAAPAVASAAPRPPSCLPEANFVVGKDGKPSRWALAVFAYDANPAWSPSGDSIAFTRTYGARSSSHDFPVAATGSRVLSVAPVGGHGTALTPCRRGQQITTVLDWAPTGTELVAGDCWFTQLIQPLLSVRAVSNPGFDSDGCNGPVWLPDGAALSFLSDSSLGAYDDANVYVLDRATATAEHLAFGEGARWSPDGSAVLVFRGAGTAGWYVVQRSDASEDFVADVSYATWSPDGETFLLEQPAEPSSTVPVAGGAQQELPFSYGDTKWAPDGSLVGGLEAGALVVSEPDGSNPVNLGLLDTKRSAWAWAADGSRVGGVDATRHLFTVLPDGTGRVDLGAVTTAGRPYFSWSPDSMRIAAHDAGKRVFAVAPNGTGRQTLGNVAGAILWSGDSSAVLVSAGRGGTTVLSRAHPGKTRVLPYTDDGTSASPDGHRLAYVEPSRFCPGVVVFSFQTLTRKKVTNDCEIRGTQRANRLRGTGGSDALIGLRGPDRLSGLGRGDWISGGGGDDRLWGGGGRDLLRGDNGDDILFGGPGIDRLDGGAGNDRLHGEGGSDFIHCGPGFDIAFAGPGDRIDGTCEVVIRP